MSETRSTPRLRTADRLARVLARRIENREYLPYEWLPTERELAAEFHADRTTIRTALKSLAEKQLIDRAPGHRSRVCVHAAAGNALSGPCGSTSSAQPLAVISPQSIFNPASPAIQRGVFKVLKDSETPYRLMVFDNSAKTLADVIQKERRALESIRNEGIRGAILWHQGGEHTIADIRRTQEAGTRLVLVDRRHPLLECDFVGVDKISAAKEAVAYLLKLGHTRIAHISLENPTCPAEECERGYKSALMAHGITSDRQLVYRLPNDMLLQPPGWPEADFLLSHAETPTAIFAINDMVAHMVTTAIEACGCKVPEDFSVMGFDDMDNQIPRPSSLTTVNQQFEQMGTKAVELLLSRLNTPASERHEILHVLLATSLVIRNSCRPHSDKT
jgi:DNA-binding LacI/PurR family transcriptional regulator